MKSLPNILTMSRIFVIPALILVYFFYEPPLRDWIAFTLFTVTGITDFFDGYLARATGTVSKLGQFLDPIADKLMVAATIVMLVGFDMVDGIHIIPLVIILMREVMVSGLREFLAGLEVSVPVTNLAKWKTTFQLVSLGALIWGHSAPFGLPAYEIGIIGIWIAALLTLATGYDYLRVGLKHMT